jgi:hypothetical protein
MSTIATRQLSSSLGTIRVEMDAPVRSEGDYACIYRIVGPRTSKRGKVMGVDGFQALQLTFERIAADLRMSAEAAAGPLSWLDMDEPGFPLPAELVDLGWGAKSGV